MKRVYNYNIVIILFLICSIIALSLITKYGYIDIVSQTREGICEIQNCTLSDKYACGYFDVYYTCYRTYVSYKLSNSSYMNSELLITVYNFTCDPWILCYYLSNNINQTLSFSRPFPYGIMGITILPVIILILVIVLYFQNKAYSLDKGLSY